MQLLRQLHVVCVVCGFKSLLVKNLLMYILYLLVILFVDNLVMRMVRWWDNTRAFFMCCMCK